jgi:hypothetical protein
MRHSHYFLMVVVSNAVFPFDLNHYSKAVIKFVLLSPECDADSV